MRGLAGPVGCPAAPALAHPCHGPCFPPSSCGRHQQAPGAAAQPGGRVPHHPLREGEYTAWGWGWQWDAHAVPIGSILAPTRPMVQWSRGLEHASCWEGGCWCQPRAQPSQSLLSCSPSTPSSTTSRIPPPPSTELPMSSSLTVSTQRGGKVPGTKGTQGCGDAELLLCLPSQPAPMPSSMSW